MRRAVPALRGSSSLPVAGLALVTNRDDANDSLHNTFSFIRWDRARRQPLVCVVNFSGAPDEGYRVGLPHAGRWREVLNTDAGEYSGSGVGNLGWVDADHHEWHGRPFSAQLRVPPLGAVWLVPDADPDVVEPDFVEPDVVEPDVVEPDADSAS